MNTKNLTIAILCVCAAILGAMLMVLHTTPAAQASEVRGGDYIMVTGHFTDVQEALYIVDTAQQKLNVYNFDMVHNAIQLRDSLPLARIFGAGTGSAAR
jgi:hypothetical protein